MSSRKTEPQAADPGVPRGAATGLWIVAGLLVALRAVLAFEPNMWGWGLSLLRFVPPLLGWFGWALAALALIPAVSRRVAPGLRWLGDLSRHRLGWASTLWAGAAAALVWWLPDRVHFVGDFLLRFGTAERALEPARLFPQALPLDVFLHYTLPRRLGDWFALDVLTTSRLLGLLEAASLGALAVQFSRVLDLRGIPSLAASGTVLFGGYLGMYTGYGKATAEMAVLTAGAGVLGLRALVDPRALLPLGFLVAGSLTLHRSALGLLPALVLAFGLAARSSPAGTLRTARAWLPLAAPGLALALLLPRIVSTILTWDPVHFASAEVQSEGGLLRATWAGTRPVDLVNLLVLLSPLAPAAAAAAVADPRRLRSREVALLAIAALPWFLAVLLVHGSQGMFRDWDNFAPAGVAASLLSAWLIGGILTRAPDWEWLGVAVLIGTAVPATQWLLHNSDVDRGLSRVEALMREPPRRTDRERGTTWDFLGIRYAQLGLWQSSAEALAHAAETAASPRVLLQWGMAEQAAGNARAAQQVYHRLLELQPNDSRGWLGLAIVSWNLGDRDECRRAALEVRRRLPADPDAKRLLEMVAQTESTDVRPSP
ncbi:MAG TPA: tetratricopeptide repeat protein [Candidatus Eisenbacteria bacterium]|jgi:hypothetical protein